MASDILERLREIDACFRAVPAQQKVAFRKQHFSRGEISGRRFYTRYISPLFRRRRNPKYQEERLQLLNLFSQCVLAGGCPPAESMLFVAICLNRYLAQVDQRKQLTLDAAFGMEATQRAGNPVQQYERQTLVNLALFDMAVLRESARSAGRKVPKIYSAAVQTVKQLVNVGAPRLSEETLTRLYQGQSRNTLETKVRKLMFSKKAPIRKK